MLIRTSKTWPRKLSTPQLFINLELLTSKLVRKKKILKIVTIPFIYPYVMPTTFNRIRFTIILP